MLVCHCNGVTERAIRRAIREGASTALDVGLSTGAGACCGGCVEVVEELIHTETAHGDAPTAPALQLTTHA